jgi:hypothetical protein
MSPIQGLEKQRAEAAAATPLRTARAVAGLLRYLAAAALMVCMFVVTLLVGSYYVGPAPTVVRQESLRNADSGHRAEIADGRDRPTPRSLSSKDDSFAPTSPTVIEQEILESADKGHAAQKMAEELAAHQTDDPAARSLQSGSMEDAADHWEAKPRPNATKTQVSAVAGDLSVKADRSPRKSVKEVSGVDERFNNTGRKIAALPAAAPVANRSISVPPTARKRPRAARGDAFDPSLHPNAPGAPRPLGTTAPSRPLID